MGVFSRLEEISTAADKETEAAVDKLLIYLTQPKENECRLITDGYCPVFDREDADCYGNKGCVMKSRLLKKKSKAGTEAAIQRAARHREAEVAAELAEVSSRLTETEGKLWSARQAEKNARGLAAYHQQQAAGYTQQLDRLTDDVAKMHKQVWRSSFVSFALGAALGLAIGFMCIPG